MAIVRAVLLAGLVITAPATGGAQTPLALAAAQPAPFESWTYPSSPAGQSAGISARVAAVGTRPPGRRALIGGAIGAVAGVAMCTAISNLVKDQATGFSTCTGDGYLLFGSAGFVLGFAVGWAL